MFGRSNRKTGGTSTDAAGRPGTAAARGLWAVVRELTPAEGLALVCLASWARSSSGVAQASDRQTCRRTGVSRDVMKRLRRKLAAMGIPVTPGNNLSHDGCSYDLSAILAAEPDSEDGSGFGTPSPAHGWVPGAGQEPPSGLGARSTEAQGAENAQPWAQDDVPYAYIGVIRERRREGRGAIPGAIPGSVPAAAPDATGAIPHGELTSCPPTAPIWTGGPSIAIHLPGQRSTGLDTAWKREVDIWRSHGDPEPPPRPPLPPYEQWLARR